MAARVLAGGSTALAQGGIAAALDADDSAALHLADTVAAGAGIVDAEAADVLVSEGALAMRRLIEEGFAIDREADGRPRLGLEAAHGMRRIVHAGGDQTGAVLHAHLAARVLADERIRLLEGRTIVSLIEDSGAVTGALLRDGSGRAEVVSAEAVVLATGGYAALYPRTSSHAGATGTGVVLAARVGALIADLEFVQFHPTVLAGTGVLISEAVRGAGAVLRDAAGRRFMRAASPAAELAPRDVVAREIHRILGAGGAESVWLDATAIERDGGSGAFVRRFPGISAALQAHGYDWSREPVPVSPAAHYTMGGVLSDLDGRSTVPGLFSAGETSSTGVHGANRLASNSLLEGLVFGARAGRAAADYACNGGQWKPRGRGFASLVRSAERVGFASRGVAAARSSSPCDAVPGRNAAAPDGVAKPESTAMPESIATAVAAGLGIERNARGLAAADAVFAAHGCAASQLARMIGAAASIREESRGAHQRADFPRPDPAAAHSRAFRFDFAETPTRVPPARSTAPARAGIRTKNDHSVPEQRRHVPC